MSMKTLFLAWQDKIGENRPWFPVGRLDADVEQSHYCFGYTAGAKRAEKETGFPPLPDFPQLAEDYESSELFPLFRNRVIAPGRPDRMDYLRNLGLPADADPVEILSVNGGTRLTDNYEVFPKLVKQADGAFCCRFFLHGWRHANDHAQKRIYRLKDGETLYVTLELTNPKTAFAVQIHTEDYYMIGWAPRYLVGDLFEAMAHAPHYRAEVVRVNPIPAPSNQRVLIELSGQWPQDYQPMSAPEFQLLSRA